MTTPHWSSPVTGQKIFGPELPDYDTLLSCVRCARCLPVCPTYRETLNEIQSPRGRLALIRAVEDGRLELSSSGVEEHLYHCLDCRACNTVCPAGIPIGEVIVSARSAVAEKRPRPAYQKTILDFCFASQARLEFVFFLLRIYQRLGLDKIVRRLPLPPSLNAMAQMLPQLSKPLRPRLTPTVIPAPAVRGALALPTRLRRVAQGESAWRGHTLPRLEKQPPSPALPPSRSASLHEAPTGEGLGMEVKRVGFFVNCVMNVAFAGSSAATIRLLERFGCEVITPTRLGCCGAPQEDQGSRDTTRMFAKRLIKEFETCGELDVIVTDSAGCGSMLKAYGHLLKDDPEFAERAARFSAKVRDASEFLCDLVTANPPTNPIRQRVTYHDPCHLLNTQKIKQQPRQMLRAIPGIEFVELPESNWCCGSAGVYNITHPQMASKVLARKIQAIASTKADILVTANPGCLMQIQMGLTARGLPIKLMHISQLMDEAYA